MASPLVLLQTAPPTGAESGLNAMRAILALGAVMVALAVFLWLLKRGTFAMAGRGTRHGMSVESALALGDRRSLLIVTVEGRRLLLGISATHVSLVTELRPAAAALPTDLAAPAGGFGTALDGAITREGRG
jgi:flagellar protein FliO/FliZ